MPFEKPNLPEEIPYTPEELQEAREETKHTFVEITEGIAEKGMWVRTKLGVLGRFEGYMNGFEMKDGRSITISTYTETGGARDRGPVIDVTIAERPSENGKRQKSITYTMLYRTGKNQKDKISIEKNIIITDLAAFAKEILEETSEETYETSHEELNEEDAHEFREEFLKSAQAAQMQILKTHKGKTEAAKLGFSLVSEKDLLELNEFLTRVEREGKQSAMFHVK